MSAADVKKLHGPYKIYEECACGDSNEIDSSIGHGGRTPIYVEDIGYTCADPIQTVCYECDTDDGEPNENTEYGEYPCATLKALELP